MRSPRASAPVRLLLALAVASTICAAPLFADSADTSVAGLEPVSAPPWNPPRAVSASDRWEAVLRFPGRVASLPLAALGQATRRTLLAAEQGFLVQRVQLLFGSVRMPIMVGPASLGDRTGLGLGVGMAPPLGPVRLTAMFDASTGLYTRARARLAAGPASVEYRRDRRPSDRYFGPGIDSGVDAESRYGLLQDAVVAGIDLHSAVRGDRVPGASLSLWAGPRWSRITRGYQADEASIADEFPGVVANTLDRDFEHLAYGARLAADHRGGEPHWTHGWRASFGAERFDRPFAASPSRTGAQFTRYSLLAEGGLSFWRDPRTLRVTFTATDNELGPGSERFLVSDLARLGGSSGLAGYEPQRFHDLDVMNVRAAYIFPLADHFEMDLHADAGGAFLDMQEARPNLLRQSAGFALRGRAKTAVVASIGLDVGPEAARFVFSLGAEP